MNTERIVIAPYEYSKDTRTTTTLKSIIGKYLYHWPLFVMGIILALGIAYIYNRYTQPKYTITAKLLITDDKKENSLETAMQKMDVFESGKVIDNESEILQSRNLMARVVKDLNLTSVYLKPGRVKDEDLYVTTPVKLIVLKQYDAPFNKTFSFYIKDARHFVLKNEKGTDQEFLFGQHLQNKFGAWRLDPTPNVKKFIGKTINVAVQDTEQTINQYADKLKANRLNKLASVIELSLQDNILQRGRDILIYAVDDYNEESVIEKKRVAASAIKFIDGRIGEVTGELTHVEKNAEGFRSNQGLIDISSQSKLYLDNVQNNDTQLNDVNIQLNVIAGIEKYVNSSMGVNSAPATIGISDPGLSALVRQLMELQVQRDKLLATTPEQNPIFEPINRQISSTKSSILQNIKGIKASLNASLRQLQSNNSKFEGSIKKLPGQERQYIGIKRQQTSKENLYVYLLQKREEAALSYASTLKDSRLVDYNYIKTSSKRIVYIIAFMLGIFLPIGVIYSRDTLNDRINTRKDIENKTSVPVLGELVYHEGPQPLVVGRHRRNFEIGEQFRLLRTNLQFVHGTRERGRVTLLTSSIANEGKSFVTSNLGVTLASTGRKTIILELDMRKPQIYKNFKMQLNHKGLSDLIKGEAKLSQVIQVSDANPNLSIITAGTSAYDPSEMLEQIEIDILLEQLRAEYDDILIDTPPINIVTDAMILSRVSDVTLYIIRQGVTKAWELDVTEKLFQQQQVPKMNIVFNGVKKDRYSQGYARDYSKYGYVEADTEKTFNQNIKSFLSRF